MNLLDNVSTIMSTDLITVSQEEPLIRIEEIFSSNRIHHIPVVHKSRLVGIVSKSDYLFFKRGFSDGAIDRKIDLFRLKTHVVRDIMTRGMATLQTDDRINIALEIFKENLFHAIPIMDGNRIVGILSTYDVITYISNTKNIENTYK